MQANGQVGEQGKGRRACNSCEWGGVLELVTHVHKSVCVFLGGRAMMVNEFLARYDSIGGQEVAEAHFLKKMLKIHTIRYSLLYMKTIFRIYPDIPVRKM
jgi:hypothetical protein